MQKLTINGQQRSVHAIAYDLCHKIYLASNEEQAKEMEGYGYHISPPTPENLRVMWEGACPLRFIEMYDNFETVIPQAFEGKVSIS